MTDGPAPLPHTTSAKGARLAGIAVIVLTCIAQASNLSAWWAGGPISWRGLTTSVGIALGGLALFVSHQHRVLYYVLIGISLVLCALTFSQRIVTW